MEKKRIIKKPNGTEERILEKYVVKVAKKKINAGKKAYKILVKGRDSDTDKAIVGKE